MDPTLQQTQSFDFDRLDPVALEDTLAYLKQHPEPPAEDVALFGGYQGLLANAVGEQDWMAEPFQDMGGQSRIPFRTRSTLSNNSLSSELVASNNTEHQSCQNHVLGCYMASDQSTSLYVEPILTRLTRPPVCTWGGCDGALPEEELQSHLKIHFRDALSRWARPSKCTWHGCKSKSVFKTIHQFNIHLENIHINPLVCTKSHCSHQKPFRNKHDLERHNLTAHSGKRPWECPYDSCPSDIRTFARKDKWLQHIQETQHENDAFCPFNHCRFKQTHNGKVFETRKEIAGHIKNSNHSFYHSVSEIDRYQCALGSCGMIGSRDRWDIWDLCDHLDDAHKIKLYRYQLAEILKGNNCIFHLQHVPAEYLGKWVDCKGCASQLDARLQVNGAIEENIPSGTHYL